VKEQRPTDGNACRLSCARRYDRKSCSWAYSESRISTTLNVHRGVALDDKSEAVLRPALYNSAVNDPAVRQFRAFNARRADPIGDLLSSIWRYLRQEVKAHIRAGKVLRVLLSIQHTTTGPLAFAHLALRNETRRVIHTLKLASPRPATIAPTLPDTLPDDWPRPAATDATKAKLQIARPTVARLEAVVVSGTVSEAVVKPPMENCTYIYLRNKVLGLNYSRSVVSNSYMTLDEGKARYPWHSLAPKLIAAANIAQGGSETPRCLFVNVRVEPARHVETVASVLQEAAATAAAARGEATQMQIVLSAQLAKPAEHTLSRVGKLEADVNAQNSVRQDALRARVLIVEAGTTGMDWVLALRATERRPNRVFGFWGTRFNLRFKLPDAADSACPVFYRALCAPRFHRDMDLGICSVMYRCKWPHWNERFPHKLYGQSCRRKSPSRTAEKPCPAGQLEVWACLDTDTPRPPGLNETSGCASPV